ncbi:MAG: copper amine oxidase N-terminal domain-containing protein [Niameybacter sp.]|uniref:copper amine oxidase N-terminal domain-containing protein n=1 Tax=Niameybacter sp. TaxID=2033640 RepID=UPI002FCBCB15
MNRRKQWIVIMLLACAIGVMPARMWAKSINHLTKVVTVGQGEILGDKEDEVNAPKLNIELNDGLSKGDRFYLNLESATWTTQSMDIIKIEANENQEAVQIIGKQMTPTQFEVAVVEGSVKVGTILEIPLYVKVEGKEGKVQIDSNNTTISEETLTFANIASGKAKVSPIQPVEKVTEKGMLPQIVIEETYAGQMRSMIEKGAQSTLVLRLDHSDFIFELTDEAKLVGSKGFEGINLGKEDLKKIAEGQLEIHLPEQIQKVPKSNKGAFKIEGIVVKTKDHQPRSQSVSVSVSGDLVEENRFKALELGEYKVSLKVENEKSLLGGRMQEVSFTLQQDMKDSLLKERTLVVDISSGVELVQQDGQVEVKIEGVPYKYPALMEQEKCSGFRISALDQPVLQDKQNLNFKFQVKVPAHFKGTVEAYLEGSALPSSIDAVVLEVQEPVQVKIEAFEAQSGMKDQMGGSITLVENAAGALRQGKKVFIGMDTSMLKLTTPPLVAVTQGDLVVGEAKVVDGGVELPILTHSTKPATLVIKHFGLTLDGTVPKGRFEVGVGGPALSDLSMATMATDNHFQQIDPVKVEDFILVDVGPKNRKEITFKLGEEAYAVNGKYYHLDVPAYLEEGRVMVPMKYVAKALGIGVDKVKYNADTQKLTVYANKVIELEINSDMMYVDGKPLTMQTAAKLVKGCTMVPIGEVARALDLTVDWNSKLETATFIGYYE